ncbi:MAG: HD domain-containing protein [Oscillospiraceae bacterium]|nr:HD domain-containing protein [Oscillospiraceae bacterium]
MINDVIEKLNSVGHEGYLVGGAVRNMLMGVEPHDYDITTTATPDEMLAAFEGERLYTVGKAHGTIAVLSGGQKIEVTTMRSDGEYSDFRRPDSVCFTRELKTDLERRDFTMNALALDKNGVPIDYFDGAADIKNKIIRAVGNPETRFKEDALRILRALRFASQLGFEIEGETKKALFSQKELLKKIARERIADEFSRIVCGEKAGAVILEYSEILAQFVPEILECQGFLQKSEYHKYDVLEHICHSIDAIRNDKVLRLTMFFHDIGKPFSFQEEGERRHFKGHAARSRDIAARVLKQLCFDNATTALVLFLIKEHDTRITPEQLNKKSVRRMLSKFTYEKFALLCEVHAADDMAKADSIKDRVWVYERALEIARVIVADGECLSIDDLAINGHDIIACGYSGKTVGHIKKRLLFEIVENNLENKKNLLLKFIDINRNLW